MAKKTTKPSKERKCRNNIAMLLSLMGFKDEDPAATVNIMLARLKKIQEKAKFKKPGRHSTFKKPVDVPTFKKPDDHSTFKKPVAVSTFKKVTFKCGGKTTTVSLEPVTPHYSFDFTVGDHDGMKVTDSRNNVCYSENKETTTTTMMINNNVDHQDHSDQQLTKIYGHDDNNYMEIANSRNNNNSNVSCLESTSFDQIMNDDDDDDDDDGGDDDGGCMGLRNFIRSMGGSKARLVIEKELTSSDVKKGLGRLLIPRMNVKNSGFLKSDERRKLGNKQNISVPVFDLERRELMVNIAQWNMNKEVYVLKTGWNDIVKTNGLKQGTVIKVWAFRVDKQLCLALDRVQRRWN